MSRGFRLWVFNLLYLRGGFDSATFSSLRLYLIAGLILLQQLAVSNLHLFPLLDEFDSHPLSFFSLELKFIALLGQFQFRFFPVEVFNLLCRPLILKLELLGPLFLDLLLVQLFLLRVNLNHHALLIKFKSLDVLLAPVVESVRPIRISTLQFSQKRLLSFP